MLFCAPETREKQTCETSLTGSVGADVDDVALGPVHLVLVRRGQLGLHHDGVLRPWLEWQDEVTRFELLLLAVAGSPRRVHICDHPAVGAAGVLPVKLRHILEGSFEEERKEKHAKEKDPENMNNLTPKILTGMES